MIMQNSNNRRRCRNGLLTSDSVPFFQRIKCLTIKEDAGLDFPHLIQFCSSKESNVLVLHFTIEEDAGLDFPHLIQFRSSKESNVLHFYFTIEEDVGLDFLHLINSVLPMNQMSSKDLVQPWKESFSEHPVSKSSSMIHSMLILQCRIHSVSGDKRER